MDKQSLLLNNLILHFASEMLDAPKPDWQNKTVDELSKQLHQTKDPVQVAILAATIWASKDQIQLATRAETPMDKKFALENRKKL